MNTHSEDLVSLEELQSVLATHAGPENPRRLPSGHRGRGWRPVLVAVVAVVALAGAGVAIAAGVGAFARPLHRATIDVNASTLGGPGGVSACDLIGKPAGQVAATLTSKGIGIEWRYTHWGTAIASTSAAPGATTPQQQAEAAAQGAAQTVAAAEAVTGGSSDAVSSVPNDSVVWDTVPDGQAKAFVFVQAPDDPNAPSISTDNCGG